MIRRHLADDLLQALSDVVLENGAGQLVGIEIKAGATLSGDDIRGLIALEKATGKNWLRGVVLYTGAKVIPFAANLHGVPLPYLWSARK